MRDVQDTLQKYKKKDLYSYLGHRVLQHKYIYLNL